MKQGRSSNKGVESTTIAAARSGLGLGKRTAGAAGIDAVASSGGGGVGVDGVVQGLSFYLSINISCPPLLTRFRERK